MARPTRTRARNRRTSSPEFDQFSIPSTPFRWDKRFDTGSIYKTYDNFCDPFPAGKVIPGNSYYNGSLFAAAIATLRAPCR